MNVLIVCAHPEPKSFNGALKNLAIETLSGRGHRVKVSDHYAMKFNPVIGADDFENGCLDPDLLQLGREQAHAYENGTLAPVIQQEQEKLVWADLLILQFPFFWFSIPAVLKGWIERVLTAGFAYGGGRKYDTGGLNGRRGMLSLTTGTPASTYEPNGIDGDIMHLLWPIHNGILRFAGFKVLPPFITWEPAHIGAEDRKVYLDRYRERLLALEQIQCLDFHSNDDFGEDLRLKPGVRVRNSFLWTPIRPLYSVGEESFSRT